MTQPELPATPNEPTNLEVIHHRIEQGLLYSATAGTVAFSGLAAAVAMRETYSQPDVARSAASDVAVKGYAVGAVVCGWMSLKLKESVDTYIDRYGHKDP